MFLFFDFRILSKMFSEISEILKNVMLCRWLLCSSDDEPEFKLHNELSVVSVV